MTCNNTSSSADERYLNQQEHRNISRLWEKAIQKLSTSRMSLHSIPPPEGYHDSSDSSKRGVHFGHDGGPSTSNACNPNFDKKKFEAMQKKLAKGKGGGKRKSPLQKFDDVVTKELNNRRMSEESGVGTFEGSKKWSSMQFTGSMMTDFGRNKLSVENKVSRGALSSVEKEVKDGDPSDAQNAALYEVIDKLAQAQAFCRFDAAVKAAEAATASVPPEMAEEVAVACAKDYQSEIVDVINEKIPLSEEKKPIEVIGYIGVTKLKENL